MQKSAFLINRNKTTYHSRTENVGGKQFCFEKRTPREAIHWMLVPVSEFYFIFTEDLAFISPQSGKSLTKFQKSPIRGYIIHILCER